MSNPSPGAVTDLLKLAGAGDQVAFDAVFPLVYAELRRIAAREMRRERAGHTLQTTALVHEAYLRLLKNASLSFENRAHFLGIAARAMREILIERARARNARKRGGPSVRLTLDEVAVETRQASVDVLALDDRIRQIALRYANAEDFFFFSGSTSGLTAFLND